MANDVKILLVRSSRHADHIYIQFSDEKVKKAVEILLTNLNATVNPLNAFPDPLYCDLEIEEGFNLFEVLAEVKEKIQTRKFINLVYKEHLS